MTLPEKRETSPDCRKGKHNRCRWYIYERGNVSTLYRGVCMFWCKCGCHSEQPVGLI